MSVREQAISIEAFPIAETMEREIELAVREQSRTVYRVAFAVLRNREDAEDAAQETFMRFLRARRRPVTIRDERAWLARAAWRVAISRRGRKSEISSDDAATRILQLRDLGATADELASQNETSVLLSKLIAALPRSLREPLMLSTVEELRSAEIATILAIPEGSVRTRLMRARDILKQNLTALLEPGK